MSFDIRGAWQIIPDDPDGRQAVYVFSERHYSYLITDKDRGVSGLEVGSDEYLARAYDSLRAGSGTWEPDETGIVCHYSLSRDPAFAAATMYWNIEGNDDRIDVRRVDGDGKEYRLLSLVRLG